MAIFTLSSPEVVLNNEPLDIIIDSFIYRDGLGEDIVRVVANGKNVTPIVSKNLETAKGMVKFSIPTTSDNVALVRRIKNQIGSNVIKVSDANSDFSRTFTSMTCINDPEIQLQKEGVIELEFEGNQSV